ncbi:hypothetical protein RBB78_20425 [Tunturiibacter empetritectus]|uniref:hypothetical protein n=1 Tax=Tunturiibacter empetritectus TaxID=3069691 RepID=UPI003D9B1796
MMLRTLALSLALAASGQAQSTPAQSTPTPPADALPDAPSTTSNIKAPVVPTGPTAVIDTTMGRLTCKLYDKQAPSPSPTSSVSPKAPKTGPIPRPSRRCATSPSTTAPPSTASFPTS